MGQARQRRRVRARATDKLLSASPVAEPERADPERQPEHRVTQLELFFDLVFVFAITQITTLLTHDPTWLGLVHGALVLAAIWWAWTGYSWLTSSLNVDEGGVRLMMLTAMAVMLGVALAAPKAFAGDAVLFGFAYLLVRLLHLVLYAYVGRNDRHQILALARVAPTELLGAFLLVGAGFAGGDTRLSLWLAALAIDYGGPFVVQLGGWRIAPGHFAERYGLIILIALGESIVAIGVGAGFTLTAGVLAAAALGVVVVSSLWWLYFDVASIMAARRLVDAVGVDRLQIARDAYSYLHMPMVGGIVLFAFGLRTTIHDCGANLAVVPAIALCGGAALYLLAQVAFLRRTTGRVFRRRTLAAIVPLPLIVAATFIPALAALAAVSSVCTLVVAYEAIARGESRTRIRHAELKA
jgi:low temperature requirement protein LtrA